MGLRKGIPLPLSRLSAMGSVEAKALFEGLCPAGAGLVIML